MHFFICVSNICTENIVKLYVLRHIIKIFQNLDMFCIKYLFTNFFPY